MYSDLRRKCIHTIFWKFCQNHVSKCSQKEENLKSVPKRAKIFRLRRAINFYNE